MLNRCSILKSHRPCPIFISGEPIIIIPTYNKHNITYTNKRHRRRRVVWRIIFVFYRYTLYERNAVYILYTMSSVTLHNNMVANNVIYIHLRANPKPRKDHIIIIVYISDADSTFYKHIYTWVWTRNMYKYYVHSHSNNARETISSNNIICIRNDSNTSQITIVVMLLDTSCHRENFSRFLGCQPIYYNIVNSKL